MENSVTPDNALSLFSLCEAHLPLTAQLKRRCVEVIRDNAKFVTNLPSFSDLCTHPSLVKALMVPLCSPPVAKRQRTDAGANATLSTAAAANANNAANANANANAAANAAAPANNAAANAANNAND